VVFVSGWPESTTSYRKTKPSVYHWISFRFGIEQALDSFFSSGYEMVYTNITKKGMSGSPVLDTVVV